MAVQTQAYIGLGSNLGDRVENLIAARSRLAKQPFVTSLRSSSLYVTSPIGYADQANFINCALELEVGCDAWTLFATMQDIELALGRIRDINNQNAPRLIDIDLLVFGDEQIDSDDLIVPHPRLAERKFVLQPLFELNPSLIVPGLKTVSALINQGEANNKFKHQLVHKLGK